MIPRHCIWNSVKIVPKINVWHDAGAIRITNLTGDFGGKNVNKREVKEEILNISFFRIILQKSRVSFY